MLLVIARTVTISTLPAGSVIGRELFKKKKTKIKKYRTKAKGQDD
jgi:hypothetical protein